MNVVAETTTQVEISLRDVGKIYGHGDNAVHAIRNANIEMPRGEFVSLLGPSGCGKTTLLRILAGLETPTDGEILIRGKPVWTGGKRNGDATRPVSMMFQEARLFPWFSVIENVALPLRIRGVPLDERLEKARKLCQTVGLSGFENARPGALSGGMRQRASLARSLITDPQVLLLDEPFGALDALTRDTLNLELMAVCAQSKVTAILVTHSINEAAFLSDRVVMLAPRPARIVSIETMPFSRPRSLDVQRSPEFQNISAHLRAILTGQTHAE
ncbi:MAG: ABC transporter ATP-binding protein [Phyllobacterium sp.]